MTLGFSVEALLPHARVSGSLRMGLVRIGESEWLEADPDVQERACVFDAHPDSVAVLPEAHAAEAELAELLGIEGGLEAIARAHWEDFCLLTRDGPDKPLRLTGAAVGFPTDWRLADKIGKAMPKVHAPIDGYADQLSDGVDRFLDGLRPGDLFGRTNAFVVANGDLRYMPDEPPEKRFAQVTPDNAGMTLFVRCERETLRRLPETGAIVFTIGVYRASLDSLGDAAVARIAQVLDGFASGEGERRAVPHYAAALGAYARARQTAKAA